MKRYALVLCSLLFVFLWGCAQNPRTIPSEPVPVVIIEENVPVEPRTEVKTDIVQTEEIKPAPVEQPENDIVAQFENIAITKQTFQKTKTELETVVEELNKITLSRDYQKWLTYLSDDYRKTFSNKDVLEEVSNSLPTKGIRLKSLKDYFNFVFVPSRQNMRVDDIQFVSPTRVYVIMEIHQNAPAAIYIIEKFDDGWKLVPKNQ